MKKLILILVCCAMSGYLYGCDEDCQAARKRCIEQKCTYSSDASCASDCITGDEA